jgi:hypothetical protein
MQEVCIALTSIFNISVGRKYDVFRGKLLGLLNEHPGMQF